MPSGYQLTKDDVNAKLNNKLGKGEYKVVKFNGTNYKSTFKHKCGLQFITMLDTLVSGNKKCSCIPRKIGGQKALTNNEVNEKLNNKFGKNEYILKDKIFKSTKVKSKFEHKCGLITECKLNNLLKV